MGLERMETTAKKLHFCDWIIIPSIGKSSGQIVAWNSNCIAQLFEIKFNIIMMSVKIKGFLCFVSCMYGALNTVNRKDQWDYLQCLSENIKNPWMLVGDLNFILDSSEKEGGNEALSSDSALIQNVIQQIGFIDLKFQGDPFTCYNPREGDANIRERIDRSLVNISWFQHFPDSVVHHLTRVASDHSPLFIEIDPIIMRLHRPYKPFRGWKEHKEYDMFFENAWKKIKKVVKMISL
ncbi:uncharacterized protein LOC113312393 [Papaver somniferum]|uniref:uncharacterized protein LOC113312393 n=1 Tax=Papaver somniferum TaxID=3469 RepID=UPI000E6FCE13|nr:uncharacterized protein LOC113312393 [Papaver somniferum]